MNHNFNKVIFTNLSFKIIKFNIFRIYIKYVNFDTNYILLNFNIII